MLDPPCVAARVPLSQPGALCVGAALSVEAGCSNDYVDLLVSQAASGVATSNSGAGASSSSTSTEGVGAGGGTGGSPGSGGQGGAAGAASGGGAIGGTGGSCGDGVIDPDEECDGGPDPVPGCAACEVQCDGAGEVYEPTTHHCYYFTQRPRT